MKQYWLNIWKTRYFWIHLALSDLRSRWRRSFLGIFWCIIQPLGMTLLLSFIFSRFFKTDITTYAPYILSGIIVWEFLTFVSTSGALSFIQADAYIKQCRHPLAIYTLRIVLTGTLILMLASLSLFCWILVVMPKNFGLCWLAVLTFYPLAALMAWPLATILAYIGTRFRDVPHALTLILQGLWFVSPIYFQTSMFRQGGLGILVDYNPLYHILQIIRAPLLAGTWPSITNYLFSIMTIMVLTLVAYSIGFKFEKKVIFFL